MVSRYTIFPSSGYTHLGCWRDEENDHSIPNIEGSDSRLDGHYATRDNAIKKCFEVARDKKMVLFALQHGGGCHAADNLNGYAKHGGSTDCSDGKGGNRANDVYLINEGKLHTPISNSDQFCCNVFKI